jgi:hypothetical protein
MIARVILEDSLTHTNSVTGRKFTQRKPQVLTNPSEIKYYERTPGFSVTKIKEKKTKINKKEATKKSGKKIYLKKKLEVKSRAQLVKIANKLDALVTGDETEKELVELILETQKEKENPEE